MWRFLRRLKPFRWLRELKWFVQRGRRGWADIDAGNTYTYLARVIREMVTDLRDNGNGGCPASLAYEFVEGRMDATDDDYRPAHEAWRQILTEIADGFAAVEEYEEQSPPKDSPEEKALNARRDRGFDLLKEWFEALWD